MARPKSSPPWWSRGAGQFLTRGLLLVMLLDVPLGSLFQFPQDLFNLEPFIHEQNQEVIKQIGRFHRQLALRSVLGSNDRFGGFFADLFENLVQPLGKEVGCVRSFRHLGFAALDDLEELVNSPQKLPFA